MDHINFFKFENQLAKVIRAVFFNLFLVFGTLICKTSSEGHTLMLKTTKMALFLETFNDNLRFGGTLVRRGTPVEKHCNRGSERKSLQMGTEILHSQPNISELTQGT